MDEENKIMPEAEVVPEKKPAARKRKARVKTSVKKVVEPVEEKPVVEAAVDIQPERRKIGIEAIYQPENENTKPVEILPEIEAIPEISEPGRRRKKIIKIIFIVFGCLAVLGVMSVAGYFYYKYKIVSKSKSAENEIQTYRNKISAFVLLPDEEPTLATVTDREKLKDQPFFANAQNGDKVLLFTKAQKAILYRPSENKIIEMTALGGSQPVALQNNQPAQNQPNAEPAASENQTPEQGAEKQNETVKVAVYNGTNTKGLAATVADKISKIEGMNVEITQKANAKGSYDNTNIINLNGKDAAAQKIAEAVGGKVTKDLPEGETKPEADILIIAGRDAKTE